MSGRRFVIDIIPALPPELSRLEELAGNLWYSWHRPTRALFGPLDPALWDRVGHNPKLFLRRVDGDLLARAAGDDVYLAQYREALAAYDSYHDTRTRAPCADGLASDDLIAYFCAEYGLHESLHIYSGGLGILAGHHCKTASDLRLPFLAVGLLYRAGYFSQTIDDDGNQVATYVEVDFDELPMRPAVNAAGEPVEVRVPFPGREVAARVWLVQAGHVPVYLLDADIAANSRADRRITYQLYGGGTETRIQQELLLGVGGVRALRALGHAPTVWHLNEGHSAFSVLERVRESMAAGSGHGFEAALEAVAASTVFTTHTPVPAGHDRFPAEMAAHYLEPLLSGAGIDVARVLALGRTPSDGEELNMTTFALRGSRRHNGVSRLHGEVSAELCADCWPQIPWRENPIDHITNGVHVGTVLAQDWIDLFDRFLGKEWRQRLTDRDYWQRIHDIPDELFWGVKQWIKTKTLRALRDMVRAQQQRNRVSEAHIARLLRHLDPDNPNVLTIAFARRFATYKRATMLFRDLDALERIVDGTDGPVVFLFAGKAHPADGPGQELMREIHRLSCTPALTGKVLLVEGYDLALARRLLSGVDVWLNTPIYRTEASGTSGMKAAMNGAIHLSVWDGWWAEGFEGDNGWAILPSPHEEDTERRDGDDARTLYELLQDSVVPLYYARDGLGHSPGWVRTAKRAMASVLPRFNMNRAVEEYARRLYTPTAAAGRRLAADDFAGAEGLAAWRARVDAAWPSVGLRLLERPREPLAAGESLTIEADAALGGLAPEDIIVEALLSPHENGGGVSGGFMSGEWHGAQPPQDGATPLVERLPLEPEGAHGEGGAHRYRLTLDTTRAGRFDLQVRMYPHHELLSHPFETGLMAWVE